MFKNRKQGFTLIELLVVIAIIGLLATLSVVALNNARERARDSRRVSDIRQMQTALELYFNANDQYPATDGSDGFNVGGLFTDQEVGNTEGTGTTLMDPVPENPTPDDCGESWNDEYKYTVASGNSGYCIEYCLGNETGGIGPDVRYATEMTIDSETCPH